MSNFDEIELQFSRLLIAAAHVLSDAELAEVRRFVDVGEYGLALETTVDIYFEEKKTATTEIVSLVERLAAAMSMNPVHLREKLTRNPA